MTEKTNQKKNKKKERDFIEKLEHIWKLKMSCWSCCSVVVLVLLNIAFLVMGIGILSIGAICRIKGPVALGLKISLALLEKTYGKEIEELKEDLGDPAEKLGGLLTYLSFPIIILGAVMVIVSLLGLIAVCTRYRILFIVYIVLVATILFAEVIVIILFIAGVFHNALKDYLKKQIKLHYTSSEDQMAYRELQPFSVALDLVMIRFDCCGITGYEDFQGAEKWNNNVTAPSGDGYVTLKTPLICCISDKIDKYPGIDKTTCAVDAKPEYNHLDMGCFEAVSNYVKYYDKLIYIILGVAIFVQALILGLGLLAYCMAD